jgi:hypothetical protein
MNSNTEVAVLREHFERFRGVTLQMLEMIPEEKLAWRPAEKLRSFAEQFFHIARVGGTQRHGASVTRRRVDVNGLVATPLKTGAVRCRR